MEIATILCQPQNAGSMLKSPLCDINVRPPVNHAC